MNFTDNIHTWILESKSSLIRWMIGITLTTIVSIIGIMYSDHNALAAIGITVKEDREKINNIVLVPIIQTEQIKNINDKLHNIEERSVVTEEKYDNKLDKMASRLDDIYDIIIDSNKKKH